jgi:hypothetical protein
MDSVTQALILAAGDGDRFLTVTRESKPLQSVLGRPLIVRTIETARDAGIGTFEIVVGYQADQVRAVIERAAPRDVAIHDPSDRPQALAPGVRELRELREVAHPVRAFPSRSRDLMVFPSGTKLVAGTREWLIRRIWRLRRGEVVMRRSNRMKRILRDQWGRFFASTMVRGR